MKEKKIKVPKLPKKKKEKAPKVPKVKKEKKVKAGSSSDYFYDHGTDQCTQCK